MIESVNKEIVHIKLRSSATPGECKSLLIYALFATYLSETHQIYTRCSLIIDIVNAPISVPMLHGVSEWQHDECLAERARRYETRRDDMVRDDGTERCLQCCGRQTMKTATTTTVSSVALMALTIVSTTPRCEATRHCYECFHCNKILRTWPQVECNGTCVTRQTTHKFAEPENASTHLFTTLSLSLSLSLSVAIRILRSVLTVNHSK